MKSSIILSLLGAVPSLAASAGGLVSRQAPIDSGSPNCADNGNNGTSYVSPSGEVFVSVCGFMFNNAYGVMVLPYLNVPDEGTCLNYCGSTFAPTCQVASFSGGCTMYTNVTTTPSVFLRPLANSAVLYKVADTPPPDYFGCPTIGGTQQTFGGQTYQYACNSRPTGGVLLSSGNNYYNASGCQNLCTTTATCTSWYLSDHVACFLYSGTGQTFTTAQWYTGGINVNAILAPSISAPSVSSTSSSSIAVTTAAPPALPSVPPGYSFYTAPNGAIFLLRTDQDPASISTGAVPTTNPKMKRSEKKNKRDTVTTQPSFADCINQCK
jgi:hypothetical protein